MKHILVLALGTIASAACAGAPPAVAPYVLEVRSEGPVRLVVPESCSPEHCWHEPYLEWFNLDGPREIVKSVPITELSVGVVVTDVESEWKKGQSPRFFLHIAPTYGDAFEPHVVIVQPKAVGTYEIIQQ